MNERQKSKHEEARWVTELKDFTSANAAVQTYMKQLIGTPIIQ